MMKSNAEESFKTSVNSAAESDKDIDSADFFELKLLPIWKEEFGRNSVEANDNFFALGGNSLTAINLVYRIRTEIRKTVEVIDIFKYPTIAELSRKIAASAEEYADWRIPRQPSRTNYKISPIQHQFYLLENLKNPDAINHPPAVLIFDENIDSELGRQAFQKLLERHEILRTVFEFSGGVPVQKILRLGDLPPFFQYIDLSNRKNSTVSLKNIYERAATEPFDLKNGPLCRMRIVKVSENFCVAFLALHHILSDGFSEAIIERDFLHFYRQEQQRLPTGDESAQPFEPLTFQYKDYVYWLDEWIKSSDGRKALSYWAEELRGYEKKSFPVDNDKKSSRSFFAGRMDICVGGDIYQKLHRIVLEKETTLFVVLQACIKTFIYFYTGSEDIIVGSPVTTRDARRHSGQIGPYLNTLPLRDKIGEDYSFNKLLEQVNVTVMAAYAHKLMPVETVLEQLNFSSAALFDIGFTLQNQLKEAAPESKNNAQIKKLIDEARYYDGLPVTLWFDAVERESEIIFRTYYRQDVFNDTTLLTIRRQFVGVIAALIESPDTEFRKLFSKATPDDNFVELSI